MKARVVTASDRAAAGAYEDRSGPILVAGLAQIGFDTDVVVVPDGEPVGAAIRTALDDGCDLVVTTGGTGISPTDKTPDVTKPLLDYEIPSIPAAVAAYGVAHGVPTAMLSRAVAGVSGRALVINLPGSTGGVKDALAVLSDVLPHAVSQLAGGDHG